METETLEEEGAWTTMVRGKGKNKIRSNGKTYQQGKDINGYTESGMLIRPLPGLKLSCESGSAQQEVDTLSISNISPCRRRKRIRRKSSLERSGPPYERTSQRKNKQSWELRLTGYKISLSQASSMSPLNNLTEKPPDTTAGELYTEAGDIELEDVQYQEEKGGCR
ncbi:hypothetical protein HAX54_049223 [Datura stramonium]|uniref:Uncharacterized protein n=1 Tax=Datura stramonium TaxID=4076 RepID=A0ABS8RU26_DATST|nr:hypothetical protein [Datura stramonium]